MRRRLSILSLLFAWLLATGSQWDLVQTFAWGKMIVSYARTMPLTEAVRLTFTPGNMCGLCSAVSEAKQQQKDDALPGEPSGKLVKIPLVFQAASVFVATAPTVQGLSPDELLEMQSVARAAPPVPPPRGRA
jgi:hypothetical protein